MRTLVAVCLALTAAVPGAREVIEEVLAVVGTVPVLASDLELAEAVGLVERGPDEPDPAFRSRLLDARVRLELQYRDLERTGVLYRLELDVDAVRTRLEASVGWGGDSAGGLEGAGLAGDDLHELALRIAAVTAYAEQRLRPTVAVSQEEIAREYERFVATELTPSGLEAPPLEELAEPLRRILEERKLNAELERWTAEARRALGVTRYAP